MKYRLIIPALAAAFLAACSQKPATVGIENPDLPDGTEVTVINYDDSTMMAKGMVSQGRVNLSVESERPVLTQIMANGKTLGYYITEPGDARLLAKADAAAGTPLNDRLALGIAQLDSVDNLDNLKLLTQFALEKYRENRDNPLGLYFINTWIRFADMPDIEKELQQAPAEIRDSKLKEKGLKAARLRARTAPGSKYVDFKALQPDGTEKSLSSFIEPGKYVILDFWASWCPYCIKELPDLKELAAKYADKGLQVVGVAVRDEQADTQAAVSKYLIPWKVMYNTARIPYDIYGIGGIPHHILLSPDGTIISRGESVKQLDERLVSLLSSQTN